MQTSLKGRYKARAAGAPETPDPIEMRQSDCIRDLPARQEKAADGAWGTVDNLPRLGVYLLTY